MGSSAMIATMLIWLILLQQTRTLEIVCERSRIRVLRSEESNSAEAIPGCQRALNCFWHAQEVYLVAASASYIHDLVCQRSRVNRKYRLSLSLSLLPDLAISSPNRSPIESNLQCRPTEEEEDDGDEADRPRPSMSAPRHMSAQKMKRHLRRL
jgi:hypothetical protein